MGEFIAGVALAALLGLFGYRYWRSRQDRGGKGGGSRPDDGGPTHPY